MARKWCSRCGVESNTLDPELHLCADVKKRLAKRERQVQAVMDIIQTHQPGALYNEDRRDLAEAIVRTLMNLGVEND